MLITKCRKKAIEAYLKHGEDTCLAANTLHFDRIINKHFCDHFRNIMGSYKSVAFRIYYLAKILRVLTDSDDLYEFA